MSSAAARVVQEGILDWWKHSEDEDQCVPRETCYDYTGVANKTAGMDSGASVMVVEPVVTEVVAVGGKGRATATGGMESTPERSDAHVVRDILLEAGFMSGNAQRCLGRTWKGVSAFYSPNNRAQFQFSVVELVNQVMWGDSRWPALSK